MRAQITLEFMLLFAVFLSFLLVWVAMISNARSDITRTMSVMYKQNTLDTIVQSADEICILGTGNIRSIEVLLMTDSAIFASGNTLSIRDDYGDSTEKTRCSLSMDSTIMRKGVLSLENANRTIIIKRTTD